jgi:hypothetical protein
MVIDAIMMEAVSEIGLGRLINTLSIYKHDSLSSTFMEGMKGQLTCNCP